MKNALLLLAASFLLFPFWAKSQNVTDQEVEKIAKDLIQKLQKKGFKKNIMVEDFLDKNEEPTMLGSFLAEEISNALVNNSSTFTVVEKPERSQTKTASGKTGARKVGDWLDKTSDDAATKSGKQPSANLGDLVNAVDGMVGKKKKSGDPSLKGIDAIIKGTLTEFSGNYRLNLKVVETKDDALIVSTKGDITRTESIDEIAGQVLNKKPGGRGGGGGGEITFRKDDLTFTVVECHQAGQDIDLVFDISNEGDDQEIYVYRNNSRAIDAEDSKEYAVHSIRIADKVNGNEVRKTILAGTPLQATITFSGAKRDVAAVSKIEMTCWTQQSGYFSIELRDVAVSK